ncbi:MAG: hypothetical protein IKS23_03925 [Alphaproteobacteria bacterium]|nr:hypothetical protein [Alphaproteobacteria bacterium]
MAEELNKEGLKMEAEGAEKEVQKEQPKDSLKVDQKLDSSAAQEAQKEQPKNSLNVDQKRRSLTAEQLKEGAYRGTLTADQMDQYKKQEKNEAPLENTNSGDPVRHKPEKKKKDAFKEQDIVEYMYNAWFLASMSWCFDRIEEGSEAFINKVLYNASYRRPKAATSEAKAASPVVQEFLDRVTNLGAACGYWTDKYAAECKDKKERYKGYFDELNIDYSTISPETEKMLKEKYNEGFIDQLKADYAKDPAKVRTFFEKTPEQLMSAMSLIETTQKLAALQTNIEMTNEAMQSVKKWTDKDTGKLKTDEMLQKEFKTKTNRRQHEILVAVSDISEDARLLAEAEYINCDDSQRQEFVKTKVYDVYDQKISDAKSATQKEQFQAEKEEFKREFEEAEPRMAENLLFGRIASFEVNDYIAKQSALTGEIKELQEKEISVGHYDINGKHPDKVIKQKIDALKEITSDATERMETDNKVFDKEGLHENAIARREFNEGVLGRRYEEVKGKRGLYEEVIMGEKESNEKILKSAQQLQTHKELKLAQKKEQLEERKKYFKERIEALKTQNAIAQSSLAYVGLVNQGR